LNATLEWQESLFPYGLKKKIQVSMVGVLEGLDEGEKTKNLPICCLIDDTQQFLPSLGLSSNKHQRLWKKELEQVFRMK
jgi:hypothetical protein